MTTMTTIAPMSEHRKSLRRRHITATDVPILFGLLEPFGVNVTDLYHEKVDGIEPEETEAMRIGRYMQGPLLEYFADETGFRIDCRNQYRVHPAGVLSCTYDAAIPERRELVEAKQHGLLGRVDPEAFGPEQTAEIPQRHILQVQTQMGVLSAQTGERWARTWLPVAVAGRGFRIHRVDLDDELFERICAEGERFHREHVVPGVPPSPYASVETLRKLCRGQGSRAPAPVSERWYRAYRIGQKWEKRAEAIKERAKQGALTEMGPEHDEATTPGGHRISFRAQARSRIDTKALERQEPEIADRFWERSTTRVFRVHER